MNNAWPPVEPSNPDECLKQLVRLALSEQASAYHGVYYNWGCIRSSLDVLFEDQKTPMAKRLELETHLLEAFVEKTKPHLSPGARRHIEEAYSKWGELRNTATLYVGRHYGLPARCVDWTFNPLTGLFFACRRDFKNDGVVWWMNYEEFLSQVARQWPKVYGKSGKVEDDIDEDFIHGREKNILTALHYPEWMERPRMQAAWITLALRYDIRHDEAIHQLGLQKCGRLIVRAKFKRHLLNKLSRLGVIGASLGVGDECVETIRSDIVEQLFESI